MSLLILFRTSTAPPGQVYSRVLSDEASVQETSGRSALDYRAIVEAVFSDDAALSARRLNRALVDDGLPVADGSARLVRAYRAVTEAAAVGDAAARMALLYRLEHDDAAVVDSLLRTARAFRAIAEPLAISEALAISIILGGGALLSRLLTDRLNIEDVASRGVEAARTVSDILEPADLLARAFLRNRIVSDPVAAADVALRYTLFSRLLAVGATASDALASEIVILERFIGIILAELARAEPSLLATDGVAKRLLEIVAATEHGPLSIESLETAALDTKEAESISMSVVAATIVFDGGVSAVVSTAPAETVESESGPEPERNELSSGATPEISTARDAGIKVEVTGK